MKLFIDSANIKEIKDAADMGLVDGVTTNPSLVAKEKTDFKKLIAEICRIIDGPISAEVISLIENGMVEEARELAKLHKNIVVKIPLTREGLKAVKILSNEGIKTNVTLIFSPLQALMAAKAGATFVSAFVGRLDDAAHLGMNVVGEIMDILDNYSFNTELIVASVRNPLHVVEAAKMGAHISTVPYAVLQQFIKHPLTDLGIEKFLKDWERVPK